MSRLLALEIGILEGSILLAILAFLVSGFVFTLARPTASTAAHAAPALHLRQRVQVVEVALANHQVRALLRGYAFADRKISLWADPVNGRVIGGLVTFVFRRYASLAGPWLTPGFDPRTAGTRNPAGAPYCQTRRNIAAVAVAVDLTHHRVAGIEPQEAYIAAGKIRPATGSRCSRGHGHAA